MKINHAVPLKAAQWLRAGDAANDLYEKLREIYHTLADEAPIPVEYHELWHALFDQVDDLAKKMNTLYEIHNPLEP